MKGRILESADGRRAEVLLDSPLGSHLYVRMPDGFVDTIRLRDVDGKKWKLVPKP